MRLEEEVMFHVCVCTLESVASETGGGGLVRYVLRDCLEDREGGSLSGG